MRLSLKGGKVNTAMSLSRYLTGNSANCGKNAALPMVCTALSKTPAAPVFASPAQSGALSHWRLHMYMAASMQRFPRCADTTPIPASTPKPDAHCCAAWMCSPENAEKRQLYTNC